MLFLKLFIYLALLFFLLFSTLLFIKLLVKFLFDESLSLLVSKNSLFLLLVMKESVEFLNGCPLIIFINLWVDVCLGHLRWSHTYRIEISLGSRCSLNFWSLRKLTCTRHPWTCNWSCLQIITTSTWTCSPRSLWCCSAWFHWLSVIKNGIFFISKIRLFLNFIIKLLKVIFCKSIVFKELLYFVVNVSSKLWLVTILYLELIYKKSFELFSFLNV